MAGMPDELQRSLTNGELERIGLVILDRLKPYVEEIVRKHMLTTMRILANEILAKQRKDVADELVRILLSKALERPTTPLSTEEKQQ